MSSDKSNSFKWENKVTCYFRRDVCEYLPPCPHSYYHTGRIIEVKRGKDSKRDSS